MVGNVLNVNKLYFKMKLLSLNFIIKIPETNIFHFIIDKFEFLRYLLFKQYNL